MQIKICNPDKQRSPQSWRMSLQQTQRKKASMNKLTRSSQASRRRWFPAGGQHLSGANHLVRYRQYTGQRLAWTSIFFDTCFITASSSKPYWRHISCKSQKWFMEHPIQSTRRSSRVLATRGEAANRFATEVRGERRGCSIVRLVSAAGGNCPVKDVGIIVAFDHQEASQATFQPR